MFYILLTKAIACPRLGHIENGRILPSTCHLGQTYSGEQCTVHCRRGYRPVSGLEYFTCSDQATWQPSIQENRLRHACVQEAPEAFIRCPSGGHITVTLPQGQRTMYVQIPRPQTNVDWRKFVTSEPLWGMDLVKLLPAGRSHVTYTASSPATNNSVSCHLTITVKDDEKPSVHGCPGDIDEHLREGEFAKVVHWQEPHFTDNVGVMHVYKSKSPGSRLPEGAHTVQYIASDEAGNKAYCNFAITITGPSAQIQRAGHYRAALICPHGVQFASHEEQINNIPQPGCYWKHIRVTIPTHTHRYRYRYKNEDDNNRIRLRHKPFSWDPIPCC